MITLIRSKIMGAHAYLMWAFVIFVILSLGLPGVMQKSSNGGPWILKVNDQEIGYNTFVRAIQTQEQIARQKYGPMANMINQKALYTQTLDGLVYAELLDQTAQKARVSASGCSIESALADPRFIIPILAQLHALPAYSWQTGIDMRMLRKILSEKGMTIADFDNEVAKALSQDLIQQMVFIAGYAPSFELRSEYKNSMLGKSFRVLTLPLSNFVAAEQAAGASKPALQTFFDLHKKNYSEPEKRSATVWEFTPATFASALTDKQIESYYEKHKEAAFVQDPVKIQVRRILVGAEDRATAQTLKAALDVDPTLFAKKAQEHSLDKASAANGGLLQPFARGTHESAFDKAAFLLNAPGAISDIITTKDGLEILQLVKRSSKTYKPLTAVRTEIIDALSLKHFNDAFELEGKRIARQNDKNALEAFVAQHHGVMIPYKNVTRESSVQAGRLFGLQLDMPTLFIEKDKGYIAVVTAIEPSSIPALSAVESRVAKDFFEDQAAKKLSVVLQEIKAKAATEDLHSLAQQYKGSVTTVKNLKGTDTASIESYKKSGIPVETMVQLEMIGAVSAGQTATGGSVVKLEALEKFDTKQFQEAKSSLAASLQQERMQLTLVGFIASARRNATIKQNGALLNNMRGQ